MRWLRTLIIALLIPVALFVLSALWTLKTGDPIAVAGLKTNIEMQLHHYHFTPDHDLTSWLTQDNTDPVLEEIFVQFAKFALGHPQEAFRYLKRMKPEELNKVLPQILNTVTKAQLEEDFASCFGFTVQELSQKLDAAK